MASVLLTPNAQQEFQDLPVVIRTRVAKVFERLQNWPNVSGARPLRGNLAGRYRIRTGDYRVQFFPANDVVTVERIDHRDGFYEP